MHRAIVVANMSVFWDNILSHSISPAYPDGMSCCSLVSPNCLSHPRFFSLLLSHSFRPHLSLSLSSVFLPFFLYLSLSLRFFNHPSVCLSFLKYLLFVFLSSFICIRLSSSSSTLFMFLYSFLFLHILSLVFLSLPVFHFCLYIILF